MTLSIPLIPKSEQLHNAWFKSEQSANSALVKTTGQHQEALIYVAFGDDYIAGLRTDRRTWVMLPAQAVSSVTFRHLGGDVLPPIRQTSGSARDYLQNFGSVDFRIFCIGEVEPLPSSRVALHGHWLVLSRADDNSAERLVALDSVRLIEVLDLQAALGDLDNPKWGNK